MAIDEFTTAAHLGKVAYEGYAESTGGKTHDGRDMPAWKDLGDRIKIAWIAAAGSAVEAFEYSRHKKD